MLNNSQPGTVLCLLQPVPGSECVANAQAQAQSQAQAPRPRPMPRPRPKPEVQGQFPSECLMRVCFLIGVDIC